MIKGILKILILHTNYSSKIYVQTIVWEMLMIGIWLLEQDYIMSRKENNVAKQKEYILDIDLDFFNSENDFVKYRDIIINLTKGTDIITIAREHSYFNFLRDNIEWTNDIALQKILNLLEMIWGLGNNQTKRLKDILFKFNYTEIIPSTISAFEMVNYWLDEKTVELA